MADFLASRAKRLFQYGDLDEEPRVSTSNGATSVTIEESTKVVTSANAKVRKRRKTILLLTIIAGLAAIVIIALSIKHKDNLADAKLINQDFRSASVHSDSSIPEDHLVGLTDIWRFFPKQFNGTWINDHEFLYQQSYGSLAIVNVVDQSTTVVMSNGQRDAFHATAWYVSADKKYLCLQRNAEPIFRRSSLAQYSIFELKDGRVGNNMFDLRQDPRNKRSEPFIIRYFSWAPTGNALAYVDLEGNLYYRRNAIDQDNQLTFNGEAGEFFNGVPDWVFEEEVFEDNSALWWAPDGSKLVWGAFNDTLVRSIHLPFYGPYSKREKLHNYPALEAVPYPKVGEQNPTVELWLANFEGDDIQSTKIPPPATLDGEVHFSWVTWPDEDAFAVQWLNRVGDTTVVTRCNVKGQCDELMRYHEEHGWIDYKYRIHFNPVGKDKEDFVVILPKLDQKYQYPQLAHVSKNKTTFLTTADAEVVEILQWSSAGIYFISTLPGDPGSRHLFRADPPKPTDYAAIECITCNMTEMDYLNRDMCDYYDVSFSKNTSFFAMTCKGPDVPWACVHHTKTGKRVMVLTENNELVKRVSEKALPKVRRIEVPVPGSDQKARVKLFLPPDFDASLSYPMVVYVYGGPGYQNVDQQWKYHDFETYLAGSQNLIYAIVDPRGSGYQGNEWRHAMYRDFGGAEVDSTIAVARHLQETLPYVDATRTAVWGWSYGAFLSLSALSRSGQEAFQCGASVAPVVDWRLYDTYYTERYMGLLKDNEAGYNGSSVIWSLDNLRDKKFYVLHGTHDDNVHYQQSMLLSGALEERDILFRQQAYPDQDHSIGRYHKHLYHSLTDFFINDCFQEANE